MGERTVAFGIGPKKRREAYAYFQPHAAYVDLGFYHGAALPDEGGMLQGMGKRLRHVRISSVEEAALAERRASRS